VKAAILPGDVLDRLRTLPSESVHCCVTSPPYWGLRDYGIEGQLGLEATPEEFVAKMVEVFREVRRVLRADGTCWLNLGDSYAGSWGNYGGHNRGKGNSQRPIVNGSQAPNPAYDGLEKYKPAAANKLVGLKPKDLIGIPWRVAFALQADGWWLRQDIIWSKPNPMPESVTDRCTKAHEYLFLLTKSAKYYYNAEAIKENGVGRENYFGSDAYSEGSGRNDSGTYDPSPCVKRNKRSVWEIASFPYAEAHFATFPPKLVEPCILAGCPEGGLTLDPFAGSGTVGNVALKLGRNFIGIELNPEYIELAKARIAEAGLLLHTIEVEPCL
jgi:DNA modification methylase